MMKKKVELMFSKDPQHMVTQDVIKNGVKSTRPAFPISDKRVEDTIQNGIKHTEIGWHQDNNVDDTIKNGIIHTGGTGFVPTVLVEDVIEDGVRYTDCFGEYEDYEIDVIIEDGVKETTPGGYLGSLEMNGKKIHQFETAKQLYYVEDVIDSGIKKTEGGMLFDESKIDRVIIEGVKEIKKGGFNQHYEMFGTIEHGIKETKSEVATREWKAGEVIVDGVKETKTPGDGDIEPTIKWMKENNTNSVPDMIDDVIDNGVKVTRGINIDISIVNDTIENGIKETYHDEGDYLTESRVQNTIDNGVRVTYSDMVPREYDWRKEFVDDVEDTIENGVKETKDALSNRLPNPVGDVINNGVKEVKELPDQSGELKGYGDYYHRQEDRTKPHTEYVSDVVNEGVKETWGYDKQPQIRIRDVIKNGVKETKPHYQVIYNPTNFVPVIIEEKRFDSVIDAIKNGTKKDKN